MKCSGWIGLGWGFGVELYVSGECEFKDSRGSGVWARGSGLGQVGDQNGYEFQ